MNFYIENLTDILLCMSNSLLADPRPHIFIFVWKMMTFEYRVWMKNDFRVGIFEIFHFQKHAPNMDICRV